MKRNSIKQGYQNYASMNVMFWLPPAFMYFPLWERNKIEFD